MLIIYFGIFLLIYYGLLPLIIVVVLIVACIVCWLTVKRLNKYKRGTHISLQRKRRQVGLPSTCFYDH